MTIFSDRENFPSSMVMEGKFRNQNLGVPQYSILLELSASDDLEGFKRETQGKGYHVDQASMWYARRIGSKTMGFQERTPLMIAAMYGSTKVLKYIVESGEVDLNRACGSDGATALHCAAAGGSESSVEAVEILLDASAQVNCVDANGKIPIDLIAPGFRRMPGSRAKKLEMVLKGIRNVGEDDDIIYQEEQVMTPKKEYPVDISMPDINDGVYGTDEFRMYSFKVKPCSRAYSHDWTECPFVHPGENARRRDPRKYPYSCVPCPEFRKGSCRQGDACDYAHGIFESWLHPAQYRTRICKDEIGCNRKVCFFAHKVDELRPVYASTGSGMPSPKSLSSSPPEMGMSPMTLSSSAMSFSPVSTPPMSPNAGNLWQNKVNLNLATPPTLQLPGSRLKATLSARDLDLEIKLLGLENQLRHQQLQHQQHMIDEISNLSSHPNWNKQDLKPTNLDDVFGNMDHSFLSQSPTGLQNRQNNMNQMRASYPTNLSSTHSAVATAVMNSRSASFAKRSQSFIDRGVTHHPNRTFTNNSNLIPSSQFSDWKAPDGKVDWGLQQGEELNKLRKSSSFGFGSNKPMMTTMAGSMPVNADEPDVSWVNTLVKDVPSMDDRHTFRRSNEVHEVLPPWLEQLYREQEQMVA